MATLLERAIDKIDERLVLLAPPQAAIPAAFRNMTANASEHARLLREVQQLRGSVYFRDGALQRNDLSADGLHQTADDQRSWHLLMIDPEGHVDACIWYLEHDNTVSTEQLRARSCPLATSPETGGPLRVAVRDEIATARIEGVRYSEVGGWAVSERSRCTPEGLLLILATFGLSRVLGGALGLATATARHSSAAILRRLGLSPLEMGGALSSTYFDPKYDCAMELLRFDSRRSNPKYHQLIEQLKERLSFVGVVAAGSESIEAAA